MMRELLAGHARSALALAVAASSLACTDGPAGDIGDRDVAVAGNAAPPSQSSEAAGSATPRPALGTAWVVFGTETDADTVIAEVARTAGERSQGLMFREELAENAGMLFVFQDVTARAFWMVDTYIPLDIAYMDPSFRIIDIQPMEPESEALVESAGPAQYALEVNRGWFEEHGVTVGATPRVFFGM